MDDWTDGYVADVTYTYGYYAELNPQRVALAFLNAGLAVPRLTTACELGYGQGVSINIHAAAGSATWWGTDFNPSQAAFARELGAHGGEPTLYDQAFDEFCNRTDLPEFDFIGLHGIWSWISDDNRRVIVDFIRRHLKVGGVVYVSYNTMPGWAAFAPVRGLLAAHSAAMGAPGQGRLQRVEEALAFVDKLMTAKPAYASANPQVAARLAKVKEQNRNYLAHEYFTRDWEPMSFERMARWLEPAKLGFACSANFLDQVDAINLTPEQQALLREIPDPGFRQTVRDFCVNQQFRKDYWVRGERRISPGEQMEALRQLRVVLVQPRADVALKVNGALGAANLQESVYVPLLDVLADHLPHPVSEIVDKLRGKANPSQVIQAVTLLAGNGAVSPAQDDAAIQKSAATARRLNEHLCAQARHSGDLAYLASPVTGGGLGVPRFGQLFLAAHKAGIKEADQLARHVWSILNGQNQRIVKSGKTLESEAQNVNELYSQAQSFLDSINVWNALGL